MPFYKKKSSVVHERFDDETVIVNLDTGCYFSIDGAGDTIWALVVEGLSQADAVARLCAIYDGDKAVIRAETDEFLARLVEEKLIEPTDVSAGGVPQAAAGPPKPWAAPTIQKYTDMEEMLQLDPIHEVDEMGWPQARKVEA
jgi:Coenzyme PQQ synthesis protein D (PqqD)